MNNLPIGNRFETAVNFLSFRMTVGVTIRYTLQMQMDDIQRAIVHCQRCSRLISYCQRIALEKKREFRHEIYWGKPVPGFGDPRAEIWIVGLAPAAHGANRTGRMFTGDSSGNWLYAELYAKGFAKQPASLSKEDGQKLTGVFISAAVRCAPPDNKPTRDELLNCEVFLDEEYRALKKVRYILVLGKIAFDSLLSLLERQGETLPKPRPRFQHGTVFQIGEKKIFVSYHPSRQNTQTGRLTKKMWAAIFQNLKNHAAGECELIAASHPDGLNIPGPLRKF